MKKSTLTTYQKLCTEYYDLEREQNEGASTDLAFYMDYAYKANGPILEPMCGTGRFLIPMLQAGLDIEGFDASQHMLDALRQKYAQISNEEPPVWQEFLQDFSSSKLYKLIFIPFGSWGLITDIETSKKCLEIMYKHLEKGGKFVIEIETPASISKECGTWIRDAKTRDDGSQIAIDVLMSYDAKTQMFSAKCRYESIINNEIVASEEEYFEQYIYKFDEMDKLLKEVGFSEIKKYQNYQKAAAINPDTPIIFYECTK